MDQHNVEGLRLCSVNITNGYQTKLSEIFMSILFDFTHGNFHLAYPAEGST